jgi:CHAT domain-containing protein
VAHSIVEANQAFLLLADAHQQAQMVPAEVIRDAMKSTVAPYLVFLATPGTNGQSESGGLMRLAPMLLATGVQAVVVVPSAMQPDALRLFTECFYEELLRSGTIDIAVADARKRVFENNSSSADWSQPVLYLRTPDARLFLDAGTAFESAASEVSF